MYSAVEAMRERLIFSSLLGEIVPLLGAMHRIFSIPAAAQALTSHSTWLPQLQAGRDAEVSLASHLTASNAGAVIFTALQLHLPCPANAATASSHSLAPFCTGL